MGFSTKLVVGGAVFGAALGYYVRSRRARTGEDYFTIIRGLPGDVMRWADETKVRAARALEEGKVAAHDRDTELTRRLEAAGAPAVP